MEEFYTEEIEDFRCGACEKKIVAPSYDVKFCPFCGNKRGYFQDNDRKIALDEDIEMMVYEWLAKTLNIDNWLVSETVKNQMATVFLLIWPILETKIFDNDMSHKQIIDISSSIQDDIPESELDLVTRHFYDRYQSKDKYRKLVAGRNWPKIENILNKRSYDSLYNDEKIALMIFVVYRYRNNIFHGIKSIKEWSKYSEEIQLCIKFMVMLGNCIKSEE